MARVKAIANFADGSHKQGEVFDIADQAEAERLVSVQAVELVGASEPVTEVTQGQPTVATPLATLNEPSVQSGTSVNQPTPAQIAHDVAQVEANNTQV